MKLFLKILTWIAGLSAAIFFTVKVAESFSQTAKSDYDGILDAYLNAIMIVFAVLAYKAHHGKETFKIRLKWPTKVNFTLQWRWVYLVTAIAFYLIDVANVYDLYWPHIIATGSGAGLVYLIGWNYFPRGLERYFMITALTLAVLFFLATFILGIYTVTDGEFFISMVAMVLLSIIINEQM